MALPKKAKKRIAKLNGENKMLKSMCPQSRLRRLLGDTIEGGASYAGSRGYTALMKRGAPDFPLDGLAGVLLRLPGSMRWLGPVSDVAREIGGGLFGGSLGRMGAFHSLGVTRADDGTFTIAPPE